MGSRAVDQRAYLSRVRAGRMGHVFLKRVIDNRIKLPISQRWKETRDFQATVQHDQIVIEALGRVSSRATIRARLRFRRSRPPEGLRLQAPAAVAGGL